MIKQMRKRNMQNSTVMGNITSNAPTKAAETLFTAIFGERDASKGICRCERLFSN